MQSDNKSNELYNKKLSRKIIKNYASMIVEGSLGNFCSYGR